MRRIFIAFIVLLLVSGTVLAHGETEQASYIEQWVAASGIVLIILAGGFVLLWKRPETDTHPESDNSPSED
ncbi:MAG: hypothetical protein Q9P44_17050 [Anaerolineae bacterium]|nr:hypothetical protein [Anaerolineae bacterium]